jgi:hypothetical protein
MHHYNFNQFIHLLTHYFEVMNLKKQIFNQALKMSFLKIFRQFYFYLPSLKLVFILS